MTEQRDERTEESYEEAARRLIGVMDERAKNRPAAERAAEIQKAGATQSCLAGKGGRDVDAEREPRIPTADRSGSNAATSNRHPICKFDGQKE